MFSVFQIHLCTQVYCTHFQRISEIDNYMYTVILYNCLAYFRIIYVHFTVYSTIKTHIHSKFCYKEERLRVKARITRPLFILQIPKGISPIWQTDMIWNRRQKQTQKQTGQTRWPPQRTRTQVEWRLMMGQHGRFRIRTDCLEED